MPGSGKILGVILIVLGIGICFLASIFVGSGYASGELQLGGAVLGGVLFGALPLLLFASAGIFLWVRGRAEERTLSAIRRNERILGLIQSQGQVSLGTLMVEMEMSRTEIQSVMYDLVHQGLFTGFIDWDQLIFYSREAAQVGSNECPNCGGVRELVGKGIVKCPYCGVALLIPPDAPQTVAVPKAPAAPSE